MKDVTDPMRSKEQDSNGPLDARFDQLVTDTLQRWNVPGLSIAVVDEEKTWAKGYGIASLPSKPVTPSTLFYTGSTTKAFTAALVSLLVDDNEHFPQVQWDTPISQVIRDDFVLADEYATGHVTIEDALSHRSGFPRHDRSYGAVEGSDRKATLKEIVRDMRHLPLTAEPRTRYQYCNLMFMAISHMVESLTGEWMGDLLARRIFQPLHMDATFFSLAQAQNSSEDLARGYYFQDEEYHEAGWMNVDTISGAGGMISNVLDYAKWARALMRQEDHAPLSKAGYEEIWRPRMLLPQEEPWTGPQAYALGWNVGVYKGYRVYQHGGDVNAFGAMFFIFPDQKFSVVAMANTGAISTFAERVLAAHLIDEKLNIPENERFDWNESFDRYISDRKHATQTAKERFFPSVPSPPLPPPLPLRDYAGIYSHPAYHTLTIEYEDAASGSSASPNSSDGVLKASRKDTTWKEELTFEHVSGEFFLAVCQQTAIFGTLFSDVLPVQFRTGVDGKPSAVGIGWELEMKEKIWLTRK